MTENKPLTVEITSFSFKKELPAHLTRQPHGGGYIFDCRCLPNPGRDPAFKELTGQDKETIAWLTKLPEVDEFFDSVAKLIDQAVRKYIERGFDSLLIGFGCTGGQHRSVYCTERLAEHLKKTFGGKVAVVVKHYNLELLGMTK